MRFVRIPILAGALALAPLVGQAAGGDGSDLAGPLRAAADSFPQPPSRLVWYGFPLLTAFMILIAWLLVATPMKMRP
jgi:hypothetical protein